MQRGAESHRVRHKGLRLATWNIASSKNFDAVIATIASLDIDVCALQELSLDPSADFATVVDGTGSVFRDYYLHYSSALSPTELGGGRPEYYGLGIVSKYPLRCALSFRLSHKRVGPIDDAESEPRILQVVMPEIRPPLIFANTHLAATAHLSPSATRRSQAMGIAGVLRPLVESIPVILGGDFNAIASSEDLADLRVVLPYVHTGSEATYVGDGDHATIDFFWSSAPLGLDLSVAGAAGLSDHKIVTATLRGWSRPAG
jgi:endonuclease/exonuclease/phosphatase family metal-dependent hydrolase